MKFAEKKKAYHELQGACHLEADRELLKKKAPQSPALNFGIIRSGKLQREILWALLDVATVNEITTNRKPTEQQKYPEPKKEIDMTAVEAEKELLALDLATASQKEMARLARVLKAEVSDFKAVTLRKYLQKRLWINELKTMLKADGIPETKAEIKNLDSIILMLIDLIGEEHIPDEVKLLVSAQRGLLYTALDRMEADTEYEDLKSELEEKESENEDLQDQVSELEEQLEEEKKSPEATDPDPAAPVPDQK